MSLSSSHQIKRSFLCFLAVHSLPLDSSYTPMAKNQSSSTDSSMGVCEKLYNAFHRVRSISNCPKSSNPPNAIPYHKPPIMKQPSSVMIPIESGPNVSMKDDKFKPTNYEVVPTHVMILKKPKSKAHMAQPEKAAVDGSGHARVTGPEKDPPGKAFFRHDQTNVVKAEKKEEGKNSGLDYGNDKVSDSIDPAKRRMRTTSNSDDGKTVSKLDSFNERVSNYLKRAKIKIRTTTNVGEESGSF